MEAICGVGAFLGMLMAFCAGFFLFLVQPIWSIVDVATSERLSSGAKATLIILTLVLLGPFLTFFYALFGTHSPVLKKTTLITAVLFLVSVGSVFGLTALGVSAQERLDPLAGPAQVEPAAPGIAVVSD